MRGIILLSVVLILAAAPALAAIPETISYQGVLKLPSGDPVADGNYQLTFRLYSTSMGGMALWTEADTVAVSDGVFNAILGKYTPLSLAFDQKYWLGVSVGADPELIPRVELTSAPYAFRAAVAESLSGGPTSDTDWIITGTNMYSGVSGNVGIGTSVPSSKLDVVAGAATAGEFSNNGSAFSFALQGVNAQGTSGAFYSRTTASSYPATPAAVYGRGGSGAYGGFFVAEGNEVGLIGQSQGTGYAVWGWATSTGYSGYFSGGAGVRVVGPLQPDSFKMTGGAASGYVLTSDASGNGTWQAPTIGLGGSGSTNYVAKFTGSTTLGSAAIYESGGNVQISSIPGPEKVGRKPGDTTEESRNTKRLYVSGEDQQVIYGYLSETNTTEDARAAIYGYRTRSVQNDGTGYGPTQTNNAITGVNYWGDLYSFGVAGYSYNDYTRTGGVIGANYGVNYWGALGYKDENSATWGLYTPSKTYLGSDVTIDGKVRMSKDFGTGLSSVPIKVENTSTSGVALWAVTHGSDATVVATQNGSGDIVRGFNGGGSPVFRVTQTGRVVTPVVEITGGSDLAEPFAMAGGAEIPAGALVVIDDQNPGQLKLSDRPYDPRVAGVVSGAQGVNPGLTLSQQDRFEGGRNVALSGRVYALADASNGPIRAGDLLTTSSRPGYAMKATDLEKSYGSVIGKAMSSLDSGTGYVLVLVSLH